MTYSSCCGYSGCGGNASYMGSPSPRSSYDAGSGIAGVASAYSQAKKSDLSMYKVVEANF